MPGTIKDHLERYGSALSNPGKRGTTATIRANLGQNWNSPDHSGTVRRDSGKAGTFRRNAEQSEKVLNLPEQPSTFRGDPEQAGKAKDGQGTSGNEWEIMKCLGRL